MKPVNGKSLFAFICDQMEKLSNGEASVQEAQAQANLCKQANNIRMYELKRVQVQMELDRHNHEYKGREEKLRIREVESKNFD